MISQLPESKIFALYMHCHYIAKKCFLINALRPIFPRNNGRKIERNSQRLPSKENDSYVKLMHRSGHEQIVAVKR